MGGLTVVYPSGALLSPYRDHGPPGEGWQRIGCRQGATVPGSDPVPTIGSSKPVRSQPSLVKATSGPYNTVVNEEVSLIWVQVVMTPHNPETIRTPTTSNSTPETN